MRKFIFVIYMLCTVHFLAFSQGITVSGVITEGAADEPLPGVSVVVKGTTIGIASSIDGTYQITVPNAESVLVFSYMGFSTVERAVGSQRIINVRMSEDASLLEEIVVIGYGVQRRASLTSAIVSVQSNELLRSPTTSLANSLAGRLPGFSAIQYSGMPGHDDPITYIRGVGTLSESNSRPLILVDGVERPFTQLDPNEIESVSILKDAGATAVFGVRGANGVIVVTTRRGESGQARVSVSASFGLQQPMKVVELAGSYLYATTYNDAQRRDGRERDFTFSDEAILHYRLGDQPVLYPSIDWMNYIMKKQAWQDQVNVNVSGGNDRAKYFVSVSRLSQDGLFKTFEADPRANFTYNRYNYRANLDVKLTNSTDLGITLGGRIEDRNGTNDPNSEDNREGFIFRYLMESAPMSGAGIVDGKHITYNTTLVPLSFPRDGLWAYYARGFRNEVANVVNFDLSLTQKLDIVTSGLEAKFKGAYNNRYTLTKIRPSHNTGLMGVSTYYPIPVRDGTGEITGHVLEKRTDSQVLGYSENYGYARDWYFEASLNYSRRFGSSHNVSALALYNQSKNYYPRTYEDIPRGYVGMVSRLTYDYETKYLLDLSMGYNGSENFERSRRYGTFPSVSVGWTMSEENFMKNIGILNHLKLRYSFGIVGKDDGIGRFLYLPASYAHGLPPRANNSGQAGTTFGIRGYTIAKPNVRESTLGNPNITWEKARKQNVGADIRGVRNRLGINFDYFWEHRWDILLSPTASIPHHFALPNVPAINYGIVDNWGYEISFSWSDRIGSDFKYTISPNMSFSRNKRVEMMELPPAEPYLRQTGTKVNQPFEYAFFGYYYEGIEADYLAYAMSRPEYAEWKSKPGNANKTYTFPDHGIILRPGDAVYLDLNYDGVINANDRHAIGFPNYAEYNFGLNMNFQYKRFELSMLWIGATNASRLLGGNFMQPFGSQGTAALIKYVAENAWTEDNPNAKFPRISFTNIQNNSRGSSVYLVDASYARLKNLEIAYNVNVSRIPYLNSLRVFATGYNVLTFTGYKANDPETSGATYGEFFRYPPTRVYNIGLRASF
jgi:TonB-linked SusC/RagA family outer membrane protein